MAKKIKDTGKTQRRVNPKLVAKALGAEDAGVATDTRRGPISLFTLRQFLLGKLSSTGGRPRLQGTRKTRSKVSFFDEDWEKIEMLSKYYREEEGINVTSSQIASALIHAEVSKIDTSKIKFKTHSASR
ncbi:MAG TPA: hypothetical protein VJ044_19930 [Candidatus Hodarchaeales archaeon]|nr:hypothetical protein [Candidatus Hodarchaeales archaeon]